MFLEDGMMTNFECYNQECKEGEEYSYGDYSDYSDEEYYGLGGDPSTYGPEEPETFPFSPEDVLVWEIMTPEGDVMRCVETGDEYDYGYNLHCLLDVEGEMMTITGSAYEYTSPDGEYSAKYLIAHECFYYE
jgi:hypothetical protein